MPLIRAHRKTRLFVMLALSFGVAFAFLFVNDSPTNAAALPPGGTFIDDDLNTHEGFIEAIAEIGVTSGCTIDEFCPTLDVTREQMASFIARALNLTAPGADYFSDDSGSIHESNINRLAEAGISLGCGGTNYCPKDAVSRGQMASFLARAFDLPATSTDFFPDDAASGHESNINRIAADEITLGCGGGQYCPFDNVPRAQMATFLGRGLDLTALVPPMPVRTLVERFYEYDASRSGVKRYDVEGVYMPRQFSAGIDIDPDEDDSYLVTSAGRYAGWDVFVPEREWSNATGQYLNLSLTRPTRVAVVWVARWDDRPSWLNAWALSGTVGIDNEVANVYERTLGYGDNWLPGPSADGEYSRNYIVLLAEANSTPTAAPPVPAGSTTPQANGLCPVWVHDDNYQVAGPDGAMYGSWHPQIDPTYWCYFGHEHGSNPAVIPGKPKVAYQYVAAKVPQNEPDIGFKETIFQTPTGEWVRFIDHAATSSGRRVCAQLHTVYAIVYSSRGDELFRVGFKADFGVSESTDDGTLLNSSECGYNMAELAETTSSSRRIRTSADSNDYERWDARATVEAANLGMVFEHEFDIRDPFTFCPSVQCNAVQFHNDGQTGTRRTMDVDHFIFDSRLALASGTYYSNPYGTAIVASDSENAVEQYIKPGFYLNLAVMGENHCVAEDPWFMEYVCRDNVSIGQVNISNSLDPAAWNAQLLSTALAAGMTLDATTSTPGWADRTSVMLVLLLVPLPPSSVPEGDRRGSRRRSRRFQPIL